MCQALRQCLTKLQAVSYSHTIGIGARETVVKKIKRVHMVGLTSIMALCGYIASSPAPKHQYKLTTNREEVTCFYCHRILTNQFVYSEE